MGCNTSKSASVENSNDKNKCDAAKDRETTNGTVSHKLNGNEDKNADDEKKNESNGQVKQNEDEKNDSANSVGDSETVTDKQEENETHEKTDVNQHDDSTSHEQTDVLVVTDALEAAQDKQVHTQEGETDASETETKTAVTTTTTSEPATDEGENIQQETLNEEQAHGGDESAPTASAPCLPSQSIDSYDASLETRPATAIKATDRSPDTETTESANVDTENTNVNDMKGPAVASSNMEKRNSHDSSVKINDISHSVSIDTTGDTHSDIHDTVSLSVHPATAGTVDSKVDGSRIISPSHEPQVLTVETPPTSAKSRIESVDDVNENESATIKHDGDDDEKNSHDDDDDKQIDPPSSPVIDHDTT